MSAALYQVHLMWFFFDLMKTLHIHCHVYPLPNLVWNSSFFLHSLDAKISHFKHDYVTRTEIIRKVSCLPHDSVPSPNFGILFLYIHPYFHLALLTQKRTHLSYSSQPVSWLFQMPSPPTSPWPCPINFSTLPCLHLYQYIALSK